MKLTDDLRHAAANETSLFARQLLKEDVRRLEQLETLAAGTSEFAEMRKHAMLLGWTPGDLRTFELDPELTAFIEAFHAAAKGGDETGLPGRWEAFHRRRVSLLVGCLSRPRIDDL
jgi:hypothetical protein